MNLLTWALKWGIPREALLELEAGLCPPCTPPVSGRSEAAVQAAVRIEMAEKGGRLYRNNRGAFKNESGQWVRFGLANDSDKMDKILKSADLIGIRPVLITPAHVGHTIGQFVSREIKPAGWTFTGTPREIAQQAWAVHIGALGGDAAIVAGTGSL